jgi:hypothetical protein
VSYSIIHISIPIRISGRFKKKKTSRLAYPTMPRSPLPQEISDYVVDLLHDERDALKTCCLVSRSWIPRTRKHLFHEVAFHSFDDFEAWYETFQDPVNSPGCYTRSLSFGYPHEILGAAGVANQYHWVCRDFSNVVRLKLRTGERELHFCFFPLVLTAP